MGRVCDFQSNCAIAGIRRKANAALLTRETANLFQRLDAGAKIDMEHGAIQ